MNLAVWAGLAGMLLGAIIMYCGYKVGQESARRERDDVVFEATRAEFDPDDTAGRLPSQEIVELPASGKHHKSEGDPTPPGGFSLWPRGDADTEQFEAVRA